VRASPDAEMYGLRCGYELRGVAGPEVGLIPEVDFGIALEVRKPRVRDCFEVRRTHRDPSI